MNPEQIKIQSRLASGEAPGREKFSVQNKFENEKDTTSSGNWAKSKWTIALLLVVTLTIDILNILAAVFLPAVGPIILNFVNIPTEIILTFVYNKMGLTFNLENILKMLGCYGIKDIPEVDLLPTLTVSVFMAIASIKAEALLNKMPGPAQEMVSQISKANPTNKKS